MGEAELGEVGVGGTNFIGFYDERVEDLEEYKAKFPNKYRKLFKYYNKGLFGTKNADGGDTVRNGRQQRLQDAMDREADDQNSEIE